MKYICPLIQIFFHQRCIFPIYSGHACKSFRSGSDYFTWKKFSPSDDTIIIHDYKNYIPVKTELCAFRQSLRRTRLYTSFNLIILPMTWKYCHYSDNIGTEKTHYCPVSGRIATKTILPLIIYIATMFKDTKTPLVRHIATIKTILLQQWWWNLFQVLDIWVQV